MDERDRQSGNDRSAWDTDATADYPIGPDDAGNVVMHAIGFLVTGLHWITRTHQPVLNATVRHVCRARLGTIGRNGGEVGAACPGHGSTLSMIARSAATWFSSALRPALVRRIQVVRRPQRTSFRLAT